MADLEATMRATFAARSFTDEDVPDDVVHHLLDVARFAPSGGNRQGWRVVVVRDPGTRARLVDLCRPTLAVYVAQVAAGENPWNTIDPSSVDIEAVRADPPDLPWLDGIAAAPVHLVIGVDLRVVASFDRHLDRVGVISGASIYPFVHNILLAARGAGWGGALTTFLAGAEAEAQALLGFPTEVAVAALVPLGRPTEVLTRLSRRPVDEFARRERFDGEPLRR